MIFDHEGLPVNLSGWINSFHMPLFFFLSGVVLDTTRSTKMCLFRKFKTILIPYIVYAALIVLSYVVSDIVNNCFEMKSCFRYCYGMIIQFRFFCIMVFSLSVFF